MGRGRPSAYGKAPVVVVWKASKHGKSKKRMKVFKTKHVDDIISGRKIAGIPESAIWLDVGVGEYFIDAYKKKHKLK